MRCLLHLPLRSSLSRNDSNGNARYAGNGLKLFPLDISCRDFSVFLAHVFSRPVKSLIVTPLFAVALAGIRIGRILGSVSHSLACLDAPVVSMQSPPDNYHTPG